jgi:hypothetical protein
MNIDDVVLPYQLPIFFLSSIKITEDVRFTEQISLFEPSTKENKYHLTMYALLYWLLKRCI